MSDFILKTESFEPITESKSSVKVWRNSKGLIQFEVKVYNDDAIKAANLAVNIEERLQKHYGQCCGGFEFGNKK